LLVDSKKKKKTYIKTRIATASNGHRMLVSGPLLPITF